MKTSIRTRSPKEIEVEFTKYKKYWEEASGKRAQDITFQKYLNDLLLDEAGKGNLGLVKQYLSQGGNPNGPYLDHGQNESFGNALIEVARQCTANTPEQEVKDRCEIAKLLIRHGVNTEHKGLCFYAKIFKDEDGECLEDDEIDSRAIGTTDNEQMKAIILAAPKLSFIKELGNLFDEINLLNPMHGLLTENESVDIAGDSASSSDAAAATS